MELEEIQCSMCKEQFNEKVRMPMLLPDCGHSYCIQCIEDNSTEIGFNLRRRAVITDGQQEEIEDGMGNEGVGIGDFDDSDEDLTQDVSSTAMTNKSPSSFVSSASKPKFTFSCPEDG